MLPAKALVPVGLRCTLPLTWIFRLRFKCSIMSILRCDHICFNSAFTALDFSSSSFESVLGMSSETVTFVFSFYISLANSTILPAIVFGVSFDGISLQPAPKITWSGCLSMHGIAWCFMWLVVAPGKHFTNTL